MSPTLHNLYTMQEIYIGETGRKLADRFREHIRDYEKKINNNNNDASKPNARHFNFPNHSTHMHTANWSSHVRQDYLNIYLSHHVICFLGICTITLF